MNDRAGPARSREKQPLAMTLDDLIRTYGDLSGRAADLRRGL
jgi:hypothetical protein